MIVASRKSGTVIASRNTWNLDLLSGGADSSEWKAWSGKLRETLVSSLSREKTKQSDK